MAKTKWDYLVESVNKDGAAGVTNKKTNTTGYSNANSTITGLNSGVSSLTGNKKGNGGLGGVLQPKETWAKEQESVTGQGAAKDSDLWLRPETPKIDLTPKNNQPKNPTPAVPETPVVDLPPKQYAYAGRNYAQERQDRINSLYNNSMATAQSAYEQLRAEAERQSMYKKGQSNTRRITMQKYVPETLRAMGLMNSGLAADALIGMDANYMQYLMQALADEESAKRDASLYLAEQKRQAENAKWNSESDLLREQQSAWETLQQMALSGDYNETALQNYGYSWGFNDGQVGSTLDLYKQVAAEQAEAEAAAKAEQAEAEAAAKKELENSTIQSLLNDALTYKYSRDVLISIAKNRGVSEEGIANMLYDYDLVYADFNKAEAEAEATQKETIDNERVLSGREYIEYNGSEYQLKLKLSDNAKELTRNNDFKKQLKALGFTNPYDKDIPNGTTLKIKADMTGANDFNFWDDIGKAYLGYGFGIDSWINGHTVYLTYYNGEWYKSEKKS